MGLELEAIKRLGEIMAKKKWILDEGSAPAYGIFNPRQVIRRKKFFQSEGFETKVKKDFPRKGIMQLFYREKK